jgi:hypothetical protein
MPDIDVEFVRLTDQDDFTSCIKLDARQRLDLVGDISLPLSKTKIAQQKANSSTMISKKIDTLELPESRARQMASQLPLEEQASQIPH